MYICGFCMSLHNSYWLCCLYVWMLVRLLPFVSFICGIRLAKVNELSFRLKIGFGSCLMKIQSKSLQARLSSYCNLIFQSGKHFYLFCQLYYSCQHAVLQQLCWSLLFMVAYILYSTGADLIRQGWNRRGSNVLQEGYGCATVLPEQGIYLAASVYRPVHQVWFSYLFCACELILHREFFFSVPFLIIISMQFMDKVASILPNKYSQLG